MVYYKGKPAGTSTKIETVPRPVGKWKYFTNDYNDYVMCPFCEFGVDGELKLKDCYYSYCPICGAKLNSCEEMRIVTDV